ncbi:hypothetical protein [Marinomonas algicola]|uniref:hypothetical protein n=1 Tax=Marinomonas algicola TaxID=2773454 RepID=UPI00174A9B18|nr:hypothetical protein [Marinomonas algicola]
MAMESKYKQTQKLLRIATEVGGYSNKEVAKKAGLKESSVSLASRWRNGKALATERQMQYFINEYGGQLKRRNSHLFYGLTLSENKKSICFKYTKLEGEELFSHKIPSNLKVNSVRKIGESNEKIKAIKLVVLEKEQGFALVKLVRACLFEYSIEENELITININQDKELWIHGDAENSNWFAEQVVQCSSFDDLVVEFNDFMLSLSTKGGFLKLHEIFFSILDTEPVSFSFYHKCLKLGLHSKHLPF